MDPTPATLFPAWLGRLFAIDVPADAAIEAVEPGFRGGSLWLVLPGGLALLAVAVFAGILSFTERGPLGPVRRLFSVGLRTALVAVLLLLLAKPVMTLVLKRERPRGVIVLLDNSQSMKLQDRRVT